MKRPFFEDFPPPSRPRDVKGGIRARSRRGAFGRSWWARRWIAVREGLELGGRLGRGRFLIFRLRGLDRDELVRRLDRAAATAPVPTPAAGGAEGGPPAPLSPEPSEFWRGRDLPEGFLGEVEAPPVTAALLGRLGQF